MVKYTITVCNLNMAETLEESLRSILNQIDERFEVLVVDDGSTDGSLQILEKLTDEYENLRYIEDNNSNLAEARNSAFQHARGKYIIDSLDADDKHKEFIQDLVEIYHQLEDKLDFDFYFSNMCKRETLLKLGGYRSLGYGEDRDLWRRLFASDNVVFLSCKIFEPFSEVIGYKLDLWDKIKTGFWYRVTELRAGISFLSYMKWALTVDEKWKIPFNLLMIPLARLYLFFSEKECYEAPDGFEEKGKLDKMFENRRKSLPEYEKEFGIKIDRSKLSEQGEKIFFGE